MTAPKSPTYLFVYGTLMPGDVRWRILEPFAADVGTPDSTDGVLYDTGLDYPAAVFDGRFGSGAVPVLGRTYLLRDDRLDEGLAVLDEEEDTVDGLYRRVTVNTHRGVTAWAYEYGDGLELTLIPRGNWFDR